MGWILIEKPSGLTSMEVTRCVKRLMNVKAAGHAGTLDPLASGVLPVALGKTTKLIPFLFKASKSYSFTVAWGIATTTDDSLGQITQQCSVFPETAAIKDILPQWTGWIWQQPPAYCAAKIQGKRAYRLAKQDPTLSLQPRRIWISDMQLIKSSRTEASFEITCGTGTYVRSLARDMARCLGTYGHISQLQRTRVGLFNLLQCIRLDFFEKMTHKEREASQKPPQCVLDDIPVYVLGEKERDALWQGRPVSCTMTQGSVVACLYQGDLVALAKAEGGHLFPSRCFVKEKPL